jgi:hypothetical protein
MGISYEYEKLPLVDLSAPRVLSRRNRVRNGNPDETIFQDMEDALKILKLADLEVNLCKENIVDAKEKYMIETEPANGETTSEALKMRQKGVRKPHYARLVVFADRLVFHSACCLPLKIVAASLDGKPVSGRILFISYSEEKGGKLVYEFSGKGSEIMIDLKRGKSTRAQRLIFNLASLLAMKELS